MKTSKYSSALLVDEMMELDLTKEVTELEMPFNMILGRYDYFLQSSIGERFYDQLKAPKEQLYWFENSAHGALYDKPENFIDIVTNIIL
jgi:pimeloyl-ACP methyl ester carboxylesterase